MIAQGSAVRVSVGGIQAVAGRIAPGLRAKILKDWGPPEKTTLMTRRRQARA